MKQGMFHIPLICLISFDGNSFTTILLRVIEMVVCFGGVWFDFHIDLILVCGYRLFKLDVRLQRSCMKLSFVFIIVVTQPHK